MFGERERDGRLVGDVTMSTWGLGQETPDTNRKFSDVGPSPLSLYTRPYHGDSTLKPKDRGGPSGYCSRTSSNSYFWRASSDYSHRSRMSRFCGTGMPIPVRGSSRTHPTVLPIPVPIPIGVSLFPPKSRHDRGSTLLYYTFFVSI